MGHSTQPPSQRHQRPSATKAAAKVTSRHCDRRARASADHTQSPKADCHRVSAATAAVSARRMRGPRLACTTAGWAARRGRARWSEKACGADEDGPGAGGLGGEAGGDTGAGFVAPQDAAIGPCGQQFIKRLQRIDGRHEGGTALLGGLAGIGLHAVTVQPVRIGEIGLHRAEPRHAQLYRLFHDIDGFGLFPGAKHSQRSGATFAGGFAGRRPERRGACWPRPRWRAIRHAGR